MAKIHLTRKVEPGSNDRKWDTIHVESNAPVPASINLKGLAVPTQFKFPVKIMDQGKVIAKTFIEVGPSKLSQDKLAFVDSVVAGLDTGKELAQRQFPENTDKPLVTVAYSNEKDPIGGKLLINTFREDGTQEMSWHLTDGMKGVPGKWGGAGFAHDKEGNRQPEDYILGGMSGPEFKSASQVARFIISNSLAQSMPYDLQQAA